MSGRKIVRVLDNGNIYYGEIKEERVYKINGSIFEDFTVATDGTELSKVTLLAPVEPSKVVCVGRNYKAHIGEMAAQGFGGQNASDLPVRPELFIKPNTAINNPDGDVVYPKGAERVDFEGEIALVIKKRAKNVRREDAKDYILGYALLNDVSRRDKPKPETQWTRGKSYDTFCPIGPWITMLNDWEGITLRTTVNGEIKQDSSSDYMIFKMDEIIESITSTMTLLQGDVVATGTPEGVGPVKVGDVITISSDQLGELTNRMVEDRK